MDGLWRFTILLPCLLAVLGVGALRPNDESSQNTLPMHATSDNASVATEQTEIVAHLARDSTHLEKDKERSLLSIRGEGQSTAMVWKKKDKDKDKIKNKPGASCPTEGLDKHKQDSGGYLGWWGSKKQKSKLILTVPYGHNFPKQQGKFGFTTDVPDVYARLHIQIGSDSYVATTSVEANTFNPQWNFRCAFPIPKEAVDVTISGQVWDSNSNRQDTFLGTIGPISFSIGKTTPQNQEISLPECGPCAVNIGVVTKKSKPTEPPWLFIGLCSAGVAGAILLCGAVYYVAARRPHDQKESQKMDMSGARPDPAGPWAGPPAGHWGPGPPAAQRAAAQWAPAVGHH